MRQLRLVQAGQQGPLGPAEVRASSFAAAGPGRPGQHRPELVHAHASSCVPARGPLGR
eukprot:NODE_2817_length_1034_cov_11.174619_g2356_i0.p6 GENE.NODE_2817_length_1034_cov_11.174619_g2356_i0~~NODE_2817_length_1034_cov_11.174619_g2356_i0.p6  ORF type:complete len:58 (+),score=2.69 NODE_2817_length_1034_cov_11.174619_g2356_i0:319-492(+)